MPDLPRPPLTDHPIHAPRLLLALDKFKCTLSSLEAAAALRVGIERACPAAGITTIPVADGGDGTVDAAVSVGYTRERFVVTGPVGNPVTAETALRGETAIIEVAGICGLAQLPDGVRRPLDSTSRGVGELILLLAERGVTTIVLGLGGSATTDGGTGMLSALGVVLSDAAGVPLAPGGGALDQLASVDWSGLDPRMRNLDLMIASDVESPLLGPHGAAHTFGPQKGADEAMVNQLEAGLETLVSVLAQYPPSRTAGKPPASIALEPGAGAAGGLGFGGLLLGFHITSGARLVLDFLGIRALIREADLVITGEGRLDQQSLQGKVPIAIARIAAEESVPTAAVVGLNTISEKEWTAAGLNSVWAMSDVDAGTAASVALSRKVLGVIGERIGVNFTGRPQGNWTSGSSS